MSEAHVGGSLRKRLDNLGLAVACAEEALEGTRVRAVQEPRVVHHERRHGERGGERAAAHQEGRTNARQESEVKIAVREQGKAQISSLHRINK